MDSWRGAGGHSLAELLVATAVIGLVLAGVFTVLQSGLETYGWGAARVDAQQSARIALERMVKELRDAGYDPRLAGIAPIVAAGPAGVTFQRDLDGDGVVDATRERVTFLLRPGETVLRRDAGAGAQPIIEGVRRFVLTYFDGAGRATADTGKIASIQIYLETGLAGPVIVMQTRVSLRNRQGRVRRSPAVSRLES
jgi:type II secretory pathway component PulJ